MSDRTSTRSWIWLAATVLAVVAAHLLDRWAYTALFMPDVYEQDWGRLLRVMGFAPTWLVIGGAVWLEGRWRDAPSGLAGRQTLLVLVLAIAVGGLGSEALKLLIRRERPGEGLEYLFRSFAVDPLSTRRLGMPSGHTMVAFAGAAALGRRFRGAGPVLLALAAGCGLTRVMAHAHYLSDVVTAAVLGIPIGSWAAARVRAVPARATAIDSAATTAGGPSGV